MEKLLDLSAMGKFFGCQHALPFALDLRALLDLRSLIFSAVVIATVVGLPYIFPSKKRHTTSSTPVLGHPSDRDFHGPLLEGYFRHPNSLFSVPTAHHATTIVPPQFLDQIKNLPDNILSFENHLKERFLGKYTGLGINDTLVRSVKVDLTKNIPNILGELQDEVGYSIDKHIGPCKEWTSYPTYEMLLHLVSLLSGRIFVGHPLSRDATWLHYTVRYTIDAFVGAEKLWNYPKTLHPIMQYLIPEVRLVHSYLSHGAKLLGPIIQERNRLSPTDKRPSDMIQWIIDNSEPSKKADVAYITKTQMLISMVAIHTTTMTMAQVIFDLVAHPEYIDILREEIQQVHPDENAPWTKGMIAGLRKMDSFMKESQRFRPPGMVTLNRVVEQQIRLGDGVMLDKGMHIGVAAGSNAMDPILFPQPEEFDGLRFLKIRELPGNDNKYNFVTSGPDQLHWGAGTHVCPGRFFASYEIKMLVAKIITDYDLKLPSGDTVRPPDAKIDIRLVPNAVAEVSFRKRRV